MNPFDYESEIYVVNWSIKNVFLIRFHFSCYRQHRGCSFNRIEGKEKRSPYFGRRLRYICLFHWMKRSIWCISCTRLPSEHSLIPCDSFHLAVVLYRVPFQPPKSDTHCFLEKVYASSTFIGRKLYWNIFQAVLE